MLSAAVRRRPPAQAAQDQATAQAQATARTQAVDVLARFAALTVAEQTALERAFRSVSRSKAFQRWLAGSGGLPLAMPITAD